jgi:hypothetical protein
MLKSRPGIVSQKGSCQVMMVEKTGRVFLDIFYFFWVSHRLGDKTGDYTGDDVEPTLPAVLVEFFKDIFLSLRNKLGFWFHSSQIAQIVHF